MPPRPPSEALFAARERPTKPIAHDFVLEELHALAPTTNPMFGCTAVYVGERIVFILRGRGDADDGVWVAFEPTRELEIMAALPTLTAITAIPNARGWRKLAQSSPSFEDDVLRACAMVRAGDSPIGKVPARKGRAKLDAAAPRGAREGTSRALKVAKAQARDATQAKGAMLKPMAASKEPSHPVKALSSADAALVERLRKVCLTFPEANERLSHGEPTWFAGKGKVFAMLDNHHHGASHLSVWLPQQPGVQSELIGLDPERFFQPPYVGPSGWVGVVLDTKPDWTMVARLIRDSFVHVATKKLIVRLPPE
jgi:predicted DNA-binding protein (MmcQ/YjbR family)